MRDPRLFKIANGIYATKTEAEAGLKYSKRTITITCWLKSHLNSLEALLQLNHQTGKEGFKLPSVYTEKARAIEILEVYLNRENCPECQKPLIEGWDRRYVNLTVNHKDFDRTNNKNINYNVFHRGCHIGYHKRLRKEAQAIGEGIKNLFEAVEK